MVKETAKNNDTLGNLYAMRAGLSVISQCADDLAEAEKERETKPIEFMNENEWCISGYDGIDGESIGEWVCNKDNYDELNNLKEEMGCREKNYDDEDLWGEYGEYLWSEEDKEKGKKVFFKWLETEEPMQITASSKDECLKSASVEKKKKIMYVVIALLSAMMPIIGIIMFFSIYSLPEHEYATSLPVLLAVFGTIFMWGGFILFLKMCSRIIDCRRLIKNYIRTFHKIEETEDNIDELIQLNKSIEEETAPIIENSIITYTVMYKSLQKTYNKWLDERDWQYIDLLIYYFETGRADNLKEALLLLEREMQTKRIVGAIEAATECICSAVENMARRISSQLNVISAQLSVIAKMQRIQIEQNSELLSQSKLQNALIAKSNVTSEQLMKDVKYIRGYCSKTK